MENDRRASIDEMQLAIDKAHLQLHDQAKMIAETHESSKKNENSINLLMSMITRHVDREADQEEIQKEISNNITQMNEQIKSLHDKVEPIHEIKVKVESHVDTFAWLRKVMLWTTGTGFGIFGLIELWDKIKEQL